MWDGLLTRHGHKLCLNNASMPAFEFAHRKFARQNTTHAPLKVSVANSDEGNFLVSTFIRERPGLAHQNQVPILVPPWTSNNTRNRDPKRLLPCSKGIKFKDLYYLQADHGGSADSYISVHANTSRGPSHDLQASPRRPR